MKYLKRIFESQRIVRVPGGREPVNNQDLITVQNIFSHLVDDGFCSIMVIPPYHGSWQNSILVEISFGASSIGLHTTPGISDSWGSSNVLANMKDLEYAREFLNKHHQIFNTLKNYLLKLERHEFSWYISEYSFSLSPKFNFDVDLYVVKKQKNSDQEI